MSKILLIDDEEAILRVLAMSLKSDGFDVITAPNGQMGLETFDREAPDIVLTDIKMPAMDGLEVLRRIKERNPDAEVIIITGHGDIESAVEALQYGASDFIQKPIRDKALAVALKRAREKLEIRRQLKAYTNDLETMVSIATGELERKSGFQAKLIRSANDGIVATDDEWKIVIFNPGAERIFGYKRHEVAREMDVRDLYPKEFLDFLENQNGSKGDASPKELPWLESVILSKSGELIPVRVTGTKLREKKEMMGSVAFFQDMREIKRLERELVNSERLAAIGQTVAGMAHCIKNILHGFKGGGYLVDIGIDRNNTDKLKKGWEMIQRNIVRTSDLVLDLLSYSKQREPEVTCSRPNDIADDVCELLHPVASQYEIEIVRAFSGEVTEAWIDPRSTHRCLMNLVSNAIDACMYDEHFYKEHRVMVGTGMGMDGTIRFEVTDNGSGMSAEVKEKLFQSFFSTKGAKGTGLGLLVTQKLVEEHGGRIFVQSEEGQGTTFMIELPQHPPVGQIEESETGSPGS